MNESSHTMAILHLGQEKFISLIILFSDEVSDHDQKHRYLSSEQQTELPRFGRLSD